MKVFMFINHKTVSVLLIIPSKSLLVIIGIRNYIIIAVLFKSQFLFKWCFAVISCDIPFEQTPVNENHIRLICGELVEDWRDLGAVLGLESDPMNSIEADQIPCREKARKVLLKWKQKEGIKATLGILIDALEEIKRRDVVDKLRGM